MINPFAWMAAICLGFPVSVAAPQPVAQEPVEELTMAIAIAKGNRNNPVLYGRRLQQELNEIAFDEAWRKMYLPSVTISASTSAAYTLAQVPGSPEQALGGGAANRGTPSTGIALNMGQYVLYNFGRDRDTYQSAELEFERSKESLREVERAVRFQVIQAVFNLKTRTDLLDASQRSVDAAEAVFDLVKSRVPLGRATHADLASASIDLLNAKNVLIANQTSYSQALWDLNVVLGDPVGHRYKLKAEIKFIKFRMPLEEVVSIFKQNSPAIKDARKALEQRRAELRIAEKNALPLPTISFSGVSLGYNVTPTGTQPNRVDPSSNATGNWNISAALLFTVPIIGDGGFLFSRTLHSAEVKVESAELDLRNAANINEAQASGLYTALLQSENTIDNNQKLFKQSSEVFEASLQALQSKGVFNRLDIKNSLEQLRSSELDLTNSILLHYSLKLQLANLIGVDRFPEENL